MTEHDPLRGSSSSGDEPSPASPAGSVPAADEDPTATTPPGADPPEPVAGADSGPAGPTPSSGASDPLPPTPAEPGDPAEPGGPTTADGSPFAVPADEERTAVIGEAAAGAPESPAGEPTETTRAFATGPGEPATGAGASGPAPSYGGAPWAGAPGGWRGPVPPGGPAGPPGGGGGYFPPGPPGGGGGYVPPGPPGGGGGYVPPAGGGPPPYQPIRRLHRSKSRRVVAGVAGGLGEYTGVDPVLFRVLFAVLSVFGGAGILLYLVGWLFLPDDDEPASPVESLIGRGSGRRRTGEIVQAALLVVVGLILAGILANGDGGDIFLLLVVVVGVVLLVRNLDDRRAGGPPAPQPAPPPQPAYQPYEPNPYPPYDPARTAAMPAGPVPAATAVQPEPPVAPVQVKERRERSILGRLTLSALLLVLGLTAALDAGNAIEPQPRHYLALSVGVLGIGLVVGAWRGRARGLIWLGIPLTIVLAVAASAEVSLEGGTGDRLYRPQSIADVRDDYRVGAGSLRLDLSDLDFTGQSVTTRASAGVGNVEVLVPREVDVEVTGRTGVGEAELFGEKDDDFQDRTVFDDGPDGEGGGRLQLVLEVGLGRVEVERATA